MNMKPQTIPSQYNTNDTLRDAYSRGFNHGHGFACHNVPELGAQLFVEDMGRVTVDAENIREVHQSLCFSAEAGSRDYSPFEFTAHEFNELGNGEECEEGEEQPEATSEEAWNAFEAGVSDSIFADLAAYTDEDYRIEDEQA